MYCFKCHSKNPHAVQKFDEIVMLHTHKLPFKKTLFYWKPRENNCCRVQNVFTFYTKYENSSM